MVWGGSRELIVAALGDYKPKSQRQIVKARDLSEGSAYKTLYLCWRAQTITQMLKLEKRRW